MGRKSMGLDEITAGVVRDYQNIYGNRLEAIVLYGECAREDFRSNRSGIQFLLVLDSKGILDLEDSFEAVQRWSGEGVAVPLFLTAEYIKGALDSYPIEFLDMQSAYTVLYGDDPISGLVISRPAVRLQAERDGRGYLLRLRQGYLESGGDAGALRSLVSESLPGFHALFRALLWLLTGERGGSVAEVVRRVCDRFDLKYSLFEEMDDIRKGGKRRGSSMLGLADSYLEEVRKLVLQIDRMEVNIGEKSHE